MTTLYDVMLQVAVRTTGAVDVTDDVDTAVRERCVTS